MSDLQVFRPKLCMRRNVHSVVADLPSSRLCDLAFIGRRIEDAGVVDVDECPALDPERCAAGNGSFRTRHAEVAHGLS
jgi:hypothetical protein